MIIRHLFISSILFLTAPFAHPENGESIATVDGELSLDSLSDPHQSATEYDVIRTPTTTEEPVDDQATSEETTNAITQDVTADAAHDNDDPIPWDEFLRQLVEEAAKPNKGPRKPGNVNLGGNDVDNERKPASLLDPAASLASRLVGAFRVRRDKENIFDDYIDEQVISDRMIYRLEGLLGNTAIIVVTETFDAEEEAVRDELGIRWATKWHEICDTPISRTMLFSLRKGELVEYSFYTDQQIRPGSEPNPLAMLSPSSEFDAKLDDSSSESDPPSSANELSSDVYRSLPPDPNQDDTRLLLDEEIEIVPPSRQRFRTGVATKANAGKGDQDGKQEAE